MRRRGDKSAFLWFATSLAAFAVAIVVAGWLYGRHIQKTEDLVINRVCHERRALQIEHNATVAAVTELIAASAYTRRRLAAVDVSSPQEQAINAAAARALERLAHTIHQVPVGACD